jgi:hypothetical protein
MGHKIIDYPKYNDMHNMFKNKGMKTTKKPYVVEPKVTNPSVHMVDVNMAITRSKVLKKQVFKDIEPIQKKILLLIGKRSKDYKNLLLKTI